MASIVFPLFWCWSPSNCVGIGGKAGYSWQGEFKDFIVCPTRLMLLGQVETMNPHPKDYMQRPNATRANARSVAGCSEDDITQSPSK